MAPFGKVYTYPGNARLLKILAAAKLNNLEVIVDPEFQYPAMNRTPEYQAKFPIGKVPGFEGADGFCIGESDAITQYIAQSGPAAGQLLGRDAKTAAQIRQWCCFADGEVQAHVTQLLLWRIGIAPFEAQTEAKALARIKASLTILERYLAGRTWLVGDELTLADLTLAAAFYWGYMHSIDEAMRKPFPTAVAWYLRTIGHEPIKDVFGEPNMIAVRKDSPDA